MLKDWRECKECKSENIVKNGTHNVVQRYKCKECGSVFRGKESKYSAEFKLGSVHLIELL
ncbi:MAG: hypothetical protein ACIPMY_02410 [Rickettsia endosymbiont of Pentastiridius leporinus]